MIAFSKATLRAAVQAKWDNKTKPPGSLGRLESLAMQIALLQGTTTPVLRQPTVLVFAGDHGMARAGVSAFPQEVTVQMVANFLAGGAAISVLARQNGLALKVVNAGVAALLQPHAGLIDVPIAKGTANAIDQPAMTVYQAERAVQAGRLVVMDLVSQGCNCLLLGEMGIGNSASAALLMHAITGEALEQCVGRGTGLDDAGLARKQALLAQAAGRARAALGARGLGEPMEALVQFGGFEIAMLAGAILEAAQRQAVVVIDGFITTAALLVAHAMEPAVLASCVFSHSSEEQGHATMLRFLQAEPLLHLGMRLGEASGAALAYPLLDCAVALLNGMASFESAGVSTKNENQLN
jgi:nicotinate-nucleotide--dimethylbenzimidazole phosphoribosyltransferase